MPSKSKSTTKSKVKKKSKMIRFPKVVKRGQITTDEFDDVMIDREKILGSNSKLRNDAPVEAIKGIGSSRAFALREKGIKTVGDLRMLPKVQAKYGGSPKKGQITVDELHAVGLTDNKNKLKKDAPVEAIKGIGGAKAKRLRDSTIEDVEDYQKHYLERKDIKAEIQKKKAKKPVKKKATKEKPVKTKLTPELKALKKKLEANKPLTKKEKEKLASWQIWLEIYADEWVKGKEKAWRKDYDAAYKRYNLLKIDKNLGYPLDKVDTKELDRREIKAVKAVKKDKALEEFKKIEIKVGQGEDELSVKQKYDLLSHGIVSMSEDSHLAIQKKDKLEWKTVPVFRQATFKTEEVEVEIIENEKGEPIKGDKIVVKGNYIMLEADGAKPSYYLVSDLDRVAKMKGLADHKELLKKEKKLALVQSGQGMRKNYPLLLEWGEYNVLISPKELDRRALKSYNVGKEVYLKDKEKVVKVKAVKPEKPSIPGDKKPEVKEEVKEDKMVVKKSDLDFQTAKNAYHGTSRTPEKRAAEEQANYVTSMEDMREKLQVYAQNDEQKAILEKEMIRYQENWLERRREILHRRTGLQSMDISGPSNYPVKKQQEKEEMHIKKTREFWAWEGKVETSIRRKLKKEITPDEKMAEVKADVKADVVRILAAKKYNKENPDDKIPSWQFGKAKGRIDGRLTTLVNNGQVEEVEEVLKLIKETQKAKGGVTYTDKSSIWNYPAVAKKIREKEKLETGIVELGVYEGVKIVNNRDAKRVQIIFDEKAEGEELDKIKKAMKAEGWNWSFKNEAYQRINTYQAGTSAERIVKGLGYKKGGFEKEKELVTRTSVEPIREDEITILMKQQNKEPFSDDELAKYPSDSKYDDLDRQFNLWQQEVDVGSYTPAQAQWLESQWKNELIKRDGTDLTTEQRDKLIARKNEMMKHAKSQDEYKKNLMVVVDPVKKEVSVEEDRSDGKLVYIVDRNNPDEIITRASWYYNKDAKNYFNNHFPEYGDRFKIIRADSEEQAREKAVKLGRVKINIDSTKVVREVIDSENSGNERNIELSIERAKELEYFKMELSQYWDFKKEERIGAKNKVPNKTTMLKMLEDKNLDHWQFERVAATNKDEYLYQAAESLNNAVKYNETDLERFKSYRKTVNDPKFFEKQDSGYAKAWPSGIDVINKHVSLYADEQEKVNAISVKRNAEWKKAEKEMAKATTTAQIEAVANEWQEIDTAMKKDQQVIQSKASVIADKLTKELEEGYHFEGYIADRLSRVSVTNVKASVPVEYPDTVSGGTYHNSSELSDKVSQYTMPIKQKEYAENQERVKLAKELFEQKKEIYQPDFLESKTGAADLLAYKTIVPNKDNKDEVFFYIRLPHGQVVGGKQLSNSLSAETFDIKSSTEKQFNKILTAKKGTFQAGFTAEHFEPEDLYALAFVLESGGGVIASMAKKADRPAPVDFNSLEEYFIATSSKSNPSGGMVVGRHDQTREREHPTFNSDVSQILTNKDGSIGYGRTDIFWGGQSIDWEDRRVSEHKYLFKLDDGSMASYPKDRVDEVMKLLKQQSKGYNPIKSISGDAEYPLIIRLSKTADPGMAFAVSPLVETLVVGDETNKERTQRIKDEKAEYEAATEYRDSANDPVAYKTKSGMVTVQLPTGRTIKTEEGSSSVSEFSATKYNEAFKREYLEKFYENEELDASARFMLAFLNATADRGNYDDEITDKEIIDNVKAARGPSEFLLNTNQSLALTNMSRAPQSLLDSSPDTPMIGKGKERRPKTFKISMHSKEEGMDNPALKGIPKIKDFIPVIGTETDDKMNEKEVVVGYRYNYDTKGENYSYYSIDGLLETWKYIKPANKNDDVMFEAVVVGHDKPYIIKAVSDDMDLAFLLSPVTFSEEVEALMKAKDDYYHIGYR